VAALLSLATIAPLCVGYGLFWEGMDTFRAVRNRWEWGKSGETPQAKPASFPVKTLLKVGVVLGGYTMLTFWLWRRPWEGDVLDSWAVLAAGLNLCLMGVWFPWYWLWGWPAALTRWGRLHLYLNLAYLLLAIDSLFRYTYRF